MENKFNWRTLALIVIGLLILGGFFWYFTDVKVEKNNDNNLEIPIGDTKDDADKSEQDSATRLYHNHGFTMMLPKGFTPVEEQAEGGPAISITLPTGSLSYVTDASFWEKNVIPDYKYIKDEKIGDHTFKVYSYSGTTFYWYMRGNVGYQFGGTDTVALEKIISTFKFVGWPQVEGNKEDLVSFSITPGQAVSGKMTATGVLKGGYFFEANLPVQILDANKKLTSYGPGHGDATTDWMTAGPVSFKIEFDFTNIPKGSYYIKLEQDDPSGGESGRPIRFVTIPIVIN